MARTGAHVSQRDGAELLDCDLCMEHMFPDDDHHQPGYKAASRERTSRPCLFDDRAAQRSARVAVYGLAGDKSIYDRSLGININLIWGSVCFVFGLIMVGLAMRGSRHPAAPGESSGETRRGH